MCCSLGDLTRPAASESYLGWQATPMSRGGTPRARPRVPDQLKQPLQRASLANRHVLGEADVELGLVLIRRVLAHADDVLGIDNDRVTVAHRAGSWARPRSASPRRFRQRTSATRSM